MKWTLVLGGLLAALVSGGCCRMCCWQHGGYFANGQCYMPGAPTAPVVVPQAATTTTYAVPAGANPCTCQ